MKTMAIFTRPTNEATVNFIPMFLKKSLGIEPKLFYPRTSLWKTLPDIGQKNYLRQFNLHSLVITNNDMVKPFF